MYLSTKSRLHVLVACAALLACQVTHSASKPTHNAAAALQSTAAGRAIVGWLAAFDTGNADALALFDKAYANWIPGDWAAWNQQHTGGLELVRVKALHRDSGIVRVRARAVTETYLLQVETGAADATHISELALYPYPAGKPFSELRLNRSNAHCLVDLTAASLVANYVFPDRGRSIAQTLGAAERHGKYRGIADGEAFAKRVTSDLQQMSQDRHLRLRFDLIARSSRAPLVDAGADRDAVLSRHCGIQPPQHLPGSIDVLKVGEFAEPAICASFVSETLQSVADGSALILDLRDNHGGRPDMVATLASYFFAVPTHLNDIYDRETDHTREFWTSVAVPGKKFVGKPLFILTSRETFSAAEDFSYALKNLKRATLVGEITGGGAHPIKPLPLDEHFTLIMPVSRSVSPVTGTDWEGVGVAPDVQVPQEQALDKAVELARAARSSL